MSNTSNADGPMSSAETPETGSSAGMLGRALQARFAAVARQAVALGLAGATEFTHAATGHGPDGFPVGSDYGVLYPEGDLSAAQAGTIFEAAAADVRAEAGYMARGASPALAGVIAEALADWEEGAEIERANMVHLRQQQDREEEEMKRRQGGEAARVPSPGRQYVAAYLQQEAADDADLSWIAECIDDGRLIACPRCHFLHLPFQPFPLSRKARETAPPDACDVCAAVPVLCDPINWDSDWENRLPNAAANLADERALRAVTLYRLWIGANDGADALRVAVIAEGLAGMVKMARSPAETETDALKETDAAPGRARSREGH